MSSLPIIAFGFVEPWILWGVGLGAVPIIIHMLYKRRYKEMPWAAMRFLLEAARRNSRRIRLEQLVLLAVRVLILVLVALALAQPFVESAGTALDSDQPTHRILLVDVSYSMGYRPAEFSRFERAQAIARELVSNVRQGDAFQLLRICDSAPRTIIRQPAFQKEPVLDEIDRLQLTEEPGDVLETLLQIPELLPAAPQLPRKEICIISDLQSARWMPKAAARRAQLLKTLQELSEQARLTLIDVGQAESPNAAVTSLSCGESFIAAGHPVRLLSTVKNFSSLPLTEQVAELYVDDLLAEARTIEVPAGGETSLTFTHAFDAPGEHRLEVRLGNDRLALDNRCRLVLLVHDELHILLVNGRPSGRAEDDATYYLQTALSPQTSRKPWQGFTQPRVIAEGELLGTDLNLYDCVFLCNVGRIVPQEYELLQAYVRGGGALVLCLGDQVDADNYNQLLYRDGAGILPAKLGERRGNAAQPAEDSVYRFNTTDLSHPIVNPFEGNIGAGLTTTLVFEYVQASLPETPADDDGSGAPVQATARDAPLSDEALYSRVALEYDSGDPAIVESRIGQGRAVLITTSLDNRWGPWPLQRSFPPVMHETVRFAVSDQGRDRQRFVGEPLIRQYPALVPGVELTVKRPATDGDVTLALELNDAAGVVYDDTDQSGFYELMLGPPLSRRELFAVNVDPTEGDLEHVSEERLRSDVLPKVEFAYSTQWDDVSRGGGVSARERGSLSRWLLLLALCLVFIEQMLAWRFFYGFLALYVVVGFGLVRSALVWNAALAGGVEVLMALGSATMLLWPRFSRIFAAGSEPRIRVHPRLD